MPLPAGLATVTVTGTWLTPTGEPGAGIVTFRPEPAILTSGAEGTFVLGTTTATLDATGSISVELLATDDPDITPTGWTYRVTERHSDAPSRSYPLSLPLATATVDLADVAPTAPAAGEYTVVTSPPTAHAASHTDGGADEVTLTQAQVTGLSTALADEAAARAAADTALTTLLASPQPQDHGLIGWAFDPAHAVSSVAPVGGQLVLIRIPVRAAVEIATVLVGLAATGVSLTAGQNFVGVYTPAGDLLAGSADQSAAWASTGVKAVALTAPASAVTPWVWGAMLVNAGTTPSFARAGAGAVSGISSVGLTAAEARFGVVGGGLTALPASITPADITPATAGTFWMALAE